MNSYREIDESIGAKALNWAVIAGAAILLLASVTGPAPKNADKAPLEKIVVTASHATHA